MKAQACALLILFSLFACQNKKSNHTAHVTSCNRLLDSFHAAAAQANYKNYFDCFASQATFLGTDATEHWTVDSFARWCKPYFDRGKAWSFTSVQRHLYFNADSSFAWFDELLSTQMKLCRGSGVLIIENNQWRLAQYVLSMTVPNDVSKQVIAAKTKQEDSIIAALKH